MFGKWFESWTRDRRHHKRQDEARVLIISYPKSGKSLLMELVGRVLSDKYNLSEFFTGDLLAQTRAAKLLPTTFTYDGCGNPGSAAYQELEKRKGRFKGKRVIVLFRDPRDIVVSCYREMAGRKGMYRGSLPEFIRSSHFGIKKVLTFYNIWHANRGVPEQFVLVRYDDIYKDPRSVLRKVLAVIGLTEIDDELIETVVTYSKVAKSKRQSAEGKRREKKLPRPEEDSINLDDFIHDEEEGDEEEEDHQPRRSGRRSRNGGEEGRAKGFRRHGPPKREPAKLHKADYDYMNQVMKEMGCPFFDEVRAESATRDWT